MWRERKERNGRNGRGRRLYTNQAQTALSGGAEEQHPSITIIADSHITSHHITQITNTEREEDKDKMRNTTKYLIFITIIGDLLLLLCCSRERYTETTNDVMTSLHLRLSSCLL
jgi:hypothetical protein